MGRRFSRAAGNNRPAAQQLLARRRAGGHREPSAAEVQRALRDGLPLLDHRWRGRFLANATLVGPESRGSSPVRFPRDQHSLESTGVVGLYPVGEGAGYAGGIVSAALDGLRAAKAIIAHYAPRK